MAYTLSQHHNWLDGLYDRELDEQAKFEDAAEAAGAALSARLDALESLPQHQRDREYVKLVDEVFTGSKYGRACLHSLLEKVAQDIGREPSEMLIRWHGGRP